MECNTTCECYDYDVSVAVGGSVCTTTFHLCIYACVQPTACKQVCWVCTCACAGVYNYTQHGIEQLNLFSIFIATGPHLCNTTRLIAIMVYSCMAMSLPSGTLRQRPTTEASLDRLFQEGQAI